MPSRRIVITGGGDAGVTAALSLEKRLPADAELVLVTDQRWKPFYFLYYRVLTGRPYREISIDLKAQLADHDIHFVRDTITGIDADERRLDLADGALEYDYLLVTLGSVPRQPFGSRPEVYALASDLHDLATALNARSPSRLAIVGGGAVGVETAMTLTTAFEHTITLIGAAEQLVPTFSDTASCLAERVCRARGVRVRTGSRAITVTDSGVELDTGECIESDLVITAAGVEPDPLIHELALPVSEDGLAVDETLRCQSTRTVYAAGDIVDYPGKVRDGFAATLEGNRAGANIARILHGERPKPVTIPVHPRVLYLGGHDALLEVKGRVWHGRLPGVFRTWGLERVFPTLVRALL